MMGRMPWWAWVWPLLAWGVLVAIFVGGVGGAVVVAAEAVVLVATVFAAVWHAEVVAHRVGEPFGTLVLALAVTVIEVALIVSVMLGGKAGSAALARACGLRHRHDHPQRHCRPLPAARRRAAP
jgi:Ca2+:H+ antiporter